MNMRKSILLVLIIAAMLTACGHNHTWISATCFSPMYCESCGAVEGSALLHQWEDADCKAPKTCSLCGSSEGECLPHDWTDATCLSPKTCRMCGLTEGILAGHTWTDATCTAPKTCTVCKKTEGEALLHQWKDATCNAPKTCDVCGGTEGESLGHAMIWETVKEATCTEAGISVGQCSVCGETQEAELEILPHTPGEWESSKKATLDTVGQRTKSCTVCDAILESEEYALSGEEYVEAYKDSCKKYKYKDIARDPDGYKGKLAVFTGEVIQVQEQTAYGQRHYVLRVNVTKKGSYYRYYTDTIYVIYVASEDDPRILEDDIITMYGELTGTKTYTTVMGASVTIPSFTAEYIHIKD